VELGKLRQRAEELATIIAKNSPATMMASKKAIWEGQDRGLSSAVEHSIDIIEEHWKHPDYIEGPRAFAEKRAPRWDTSQLH
jgi:enoyl-CoA hydratase/carnithine racemase